MNDKTVQASDGTSVNTSWWTVENADGPATIEVSAQCGSQQVNQRITVGSIDDAPASVTQESLQSVLDDLRAQLADVAAARNKAVGLIAGLS